METVEKECGALGGLFQAIVNDMKVGYSLEPYDSDSYAAFGASPADLHQIPALHISCTCTCIASRRLSRSAGASVHVG